MSLVPVDLPSLPDLRRRWAALAAVLSATGFGRGCFAEDSRWHYDDGGGNWADLVFLVQGPVLLGHDHEYSETYFREAAAYFDEEETDLLSGAPDWWEQALAGRDPIDWVGFIYGNDGGQWWRAPYDRDDGSSSVIGPLVSDEDLRNLITEYVTDGDATLGDPAAVSALVPSAEPDSGLLDAVLAPYGHDVSAAVAAAARRRVFGRNGCGAHFKPRPHVARSARWRLVRRTQCATSRRCRFFRYCCHR